MKKILIVSTVSRQFYLFEQGNIEVLKSLGYEVHTAANFSDANERLDSLDIIRHHIDIARSPISITNLKAYKQLVKLIETEKFDAVHCHSPMGGVLARLAAKSVGLKSVIYTAHGFHFYKGAPFKNWLIYYPIEKYLSRYTDTLITINEEDFKMSQKFYSKRKEFISGIGIDTSKFNEVLSMKDIKKVKRQELGIAEESVVLLSIGELIKRKNHETALRALSKMKSQNFTYLVCGKGVLDTYLKELAASLGIADKVKFLGFRSDINEICAVSDVFLFPSYQEGLPVSVMESMSAELPVVCSSIRGNTDLIVSGAGGFLHEPDDIDGYKDSLELLISKGNLRKKMGSYNKNAVKQYDKSVVKTEMKRIYENI